MTVRSLLDTAIPRLQAAAVDTPRLDAELLLAHVLGRDRTYLFAHPGAAVSPDLVDRFEGLLQRREAREPLPYLTGFREFLGLSFRVSPAVLIPRPETETLVEAVAARVPQDARILDVGAGSGCISIGLARLLPQAVVYALEPSAAALEVARENVRMLKCAKQVQLVSGRYPEAAVTFTELDALVSNPPYIPSVEVDQLEPELRLHEPRLALDGGADGLDVLRPLVELGGRALKKNGLLALEVALDQAEEVCRLIRSVPDWLHPETVSDLAGIPRVVIARRA